MKRLRTGLCEIPLKTVRAAQKLTWAPLLIYVAHSIAYFALLGAVPRAEFAVVAYWLVSLILAIAIGIVYYRFARDPRKFRGWINAFAIIYALMGAAQAYQAVQLGRYDLMIMAALAGALVAASVLALHATKPLLDGQPGPQP
jgi:hypothetical protein